MAIQACGWDSMVAAGQGATLGSLAWMLGALIAAVALLGGVAIWARSRTLRDAGHPERDLWSLSDLREMHRLGQLSDEEFERLKQRAIGQFGGSSESK